MSDPDGQSKLDEGTMKFGGIKEKPSSPKPQVTPQGQKLAPTSNKPENENGDTPTPSSDE